MKIYPGAPLGRSSFFFFPWQLDKRSYLIHHPFSFFAFSFYLSLFSLSLSFQMFLYSAGKSFRKNLKRRRRRRKTVLLFLFPIFSSDLLLFPLLTTPIRLGPISLSSPPFTNKKFDFISKINERRIAREIWIKIDFALGETLKTHRHLPCAILFVFQFCNGPKDNGPLLIHFHGRHFFKYVQTKIRKEQQQDSLCFVRSFDRLKWFLVCLRLTRVRHLLWLNDVSFSLHPKDDALIWLTFCYLISGSPDREGVWFPLLVSIIFVRLKRGYLNRIF